MATSVSLGRRRYSLPFFGFVLTVVLLFWITVAGIVFLGIEQDKKILQYEFDLILKANQPLLEKELFRDFSRRTLLNDGEFFLKIENQMTKSIFTSGNMELQSVGQCTYRAELKYEILFCRNQILPWSYLYFVLGLFVVIFVTFLIVLNRFRIGIIKSFKSLFESAGISYSASLSFGKAWEIAMEMGERFRLSQERILVFEKNRLILEVATQVAHDIRSPLTALNIGIHNLKNSFSDDSCILIQNACSRINEIAEELLRNAKKEISSSRVSDEPSLSKMAFNSEFVEKIVSEKRSLFKNAKFVVDLGFQGEFWIQASAPHLSRIISNLIDNAVDAFTVGKGEIVVGVREYEKTIMVCVIDDGKGIPSEVLSKLGSSILTYGKENGNGIALFNARRTISEWGGEMKIFSKIGSGSVVELHLVKYIEPTGPSA